jgi:hypothetical protein
MVIPVYRAGSSRVTHPFAGLPQPKGQDLPRLACVRRAASVRPEPGSNSPLENHKQTTSVERRATVKQPTKANCPATVNNPNPKTAKQTTVRNQVILPPNFTIKDRSQRRGACPLAFNTLCSFQRTDNTPTPNPPKHHSAQTAIEA